jgi:hypothetical protein
VGHLLNSKGPVGLAWITILGFGGTIRSVEEDSFGLEFERILE